MRQKNPKCINLKHKTYTNSVPKKIMTKHCNFILYTQSIS